MAFIRFDLPSVPIPGPRPPPLLGPRANIARFFSDPVRWMCSLHQRYGAIAAVAGGSPTVVCAFGAEHNRAILPDLRLYHNQDSAPYDLPPGSAFGRVLNGLLFMNGDQHRRQRRLLMPAFQKSTVEGYRDDIVAVVAERLDRWPIGQIADIAEEMIELTLRVALRCLFGLDVHEGEENLGGMATRTLQAATSLAVVALPYDLPGAPFRRLLRQGERVEAELRRIIQRKRAQPTGQRDALSILVHARDDEEGMLSDDDLVGQTMLLFFAGHETTASSLSWALFLLSQHPEVLADLVDELDAVLRGGAPTPSQLPALPLLDAVLKESMRLLPTTPLLLLRMATADAQLGPYPLPPGAGVVLSPLITQRNPDLYPDPDRFRPERWTRLSPGPYEYLPFGAGPRMCLGAGFANLTLRLALSLILQRFRLSLAHRARVSTVIRGITMGPRHGLPMLIAPQDRYFRRAEEVRGDIGELVNLS